jgi:hypothetical protein
VSCPRNKSIFQIFKRCLDLDEVDLKLPQLGRIPTKEIGPHEVATLPTSNLAQSGAVMLKLEICLPPTRQANALDTRSSRQDHRLKRRTRGLEGWLVYDPSEHQCTT